MSNPKNSSERAELLKLLDGLDAVDRERAPKCMPDLVVDQWLHSGADARREIEAEIDRLPRKSS